MKKRILLFCLGIICALSFLGATPRPNSPLVYDAARALTFARDNLYRFSLENCSRFVARCLNAGGMHDIKAPGCTTLHRILSGFPELTVYHLSFENNNKIPMGELADILTPGDIGIYQCQRCAKVSEYSYIHTFLYSGTDENGFLHAFSHNPLESDKNPYWYQRNCYSCHTRLQDIVFFHFPTPHGWLKLDEGILYFDENGCQVSGIVEIDDALYVFSDDGYAIPGWSSTFGGWVFGDTDGQILWFCSAPNGIPQLRDAENRIYSPSYFPDFPVFYPAP